MTLCIAAACEEDKKQFIVMCSDTKVETAIASAEIEDKVRWLVPGWPALLAGNVTKCEELIDLYSNTLRPKKLTEKNIISQFKGPAQLFKKQLADEYTHQTVGMSYQRFLKAGKRLLPDRQFERMLAEIEHHTYGQPEPKRCSVLFCGFLANEPYIFEVTSEGTATYVEHFAVIGSGAYVALPALFQRKYSYDTPLQEALYYIYEAKKLGEIVPGVGKDTRIDIVESDASGRTREDAKSVNQKGLVLLEEQYQKYGLKPVPETIGLEKSLHFDPF